MASLTKLLVTTADHWLQDLDPKKIWLKIDYNDIYVSKITCILCAKYVDRLKI